MEAKELTCKFDSEAIEALEQDIKKKRNSGSATSIGDRLLIRLLEALRDDSKVFLFKFDSAKRKLIVRSYPTLQYDDPK